MAGGIITGVTANGYIVSTVEWSSVPNNSENYSDVTATLRYSRTNQYSDGTSGNWNGGIIIDGTTYYGSGYLVITQNSNTFAMTASKRVYHNSDGKKQITISAYGAMANTTLKSTTLSGVATLDDIPRAATIVMVNDFNDEEDFVTMIYSNPAKNAVESLQACLSLDKVSMVVPYIDVGIEDTTCRFELDAERKKILLNATLQGSNERLVYYGLKTVINNQVYEEWAPKKFSVVNGKPVLSPVVYKVSDFTDETFGDVLIQYHSSVNYEMHVDPQKGAAIVSQKVTCGGMSSSEDVGMLTNVESGVFVFAATDNRGNVTSTEVKMSMIPYERLTCNLAVDGPDGNGKMNVLVNGTCCPLESLNSVSVFVRYKESGAGYGDWIGALVEEDLGKGRYEASVSIELDYRKKHFVQAKVVDLIEEKESVEIPVITIPVFDWSEKDFNFNVPVTINKEPLIVNPYPVGSIWMTVTDDNPGELFGGTWEPIQDAFLYGSGELFAEDRGGSWEIGIEQLPKGSVVNGIGLLQGYAWLGGGNPDGDMYEKIDEPDEYMPPYYVVNIWKRVE